MRPVKFCPGIRPETSGITSKEENFLIKDSGFINNVDSYDSGIDLNAMLIHNQKATFLMRVNTNCMKEGGICKNDLVIVDRSLKPVNGNVIIAIINGDLLIRRFEKINNKVRLLADGNHLSPINIDTACEDFAVGGTVTYVVHQP